MNGRLRNRIFDFTSPHCENFGRNNRSRLCRDKNGGIEEINNASQHKAVLTNRVHRFCLFIPVEITRSRDHVITKITS